MLKKEYIAPSVSELDFNSQDFLLESSGITTEGQETGGSEYGKYYPIF